MFKRKLRFVTEKCDVIALADPAYLPHICITILSEHEARFIAVYDVESGTASTIFVAHYNAETKGDLYKRYTYCFSTAARTPI